MSRLGRDRGWQEGICAEFLCKTEWNRWRICSEEIGYFLLLWIVVEKHLGLLNSCCLDNGEQRAWAVFKLYHVVASRDVAQCLSWCTPATFHLFLLLQNSSLLLWLFFSTSHVFFHCHSSVSATVLWNCERFMGALCQDLPFRAAFCFPVVSSTKAELLWPWWFCWGGGYSGYSN